MGETKSIYFDACCYNRPFDDLLDNKIRLEAEAILLLENSILNNHFVLYNSRMVDYELGRIKDIDKREKVAAFYASMRSTQLKFRDEIEQIAANLEKYNIKYMDALHIAYCEHYKIDYMLTTDQVLLNASRRVDLSTKVMNPLMFVMEVL